MEPLAKPLGCVVRASRLWEGCVVRGLCGACFPSAGARFPRNVFHPNDANFINPLAQLGFVFDIDSNCNPMSNFIPGNTSFI